MQLQFVTISSIIPQQVKELYENSFPVFERRPWPQQQKLLTENKISLLQLMLADEFAGFVFYWQLQEFTFIEHFAIAPSLQGKGTGTLVMQHLSAMFTTIVLETEPAEKGINAARRISFYERLGYKKFPYAYEQPPYAPGYPPQAMQLTYSNDNTSEAMFKKLATEIYTTVYGVNYRTSNNIY